MTMRVTTLLDAVLRAGSARPDRDAPRDTGKDGGAEFGDALRSRLREKWRQDAPARRESARHEAITTVGAAAARAPKAAQALTPSATPPSTPAGRPGPAPGRSSTEGVVPVDPSTLAQPAAPAVSAGSDPAAAPFSASEGITIDGSAPGAAEVSIAAVASTSALVGTGPDAAAPGGAQVPDLPSSADLGAAATNASALEANSQLPEPRSQAVPASASERAAATQAALALTATGLAAATSAAQAAVTQTDTVQPPQTATQSPAVASMPAGTAAPAGIASPQPLLTPGGALPAEPVLPGAGLPSTSPQVIDLPASAPATKAPSGAATAQPDVATLAHAAARGIAVGGARPYAEAPLPQAGTATGEIPATVVPSDPGTAEGLAVARTVTAAAAADQAHVARVLQGVADPADPSAAPAASPQPGAEPAGDPQSGAPATVAPTRAPATEAAFAKGNASTPGGASQAPTDALLAANAAGLPNAATRPADAPSANDVAAPIRTDAPAAAPTPAPPAHAPSSTHSAAAPAGHVATPVHTQVVAALAPVVQRRDGSYHVDLQLDPASLGRVRVHVSITAGEVVVQMAAADASARDMLRQNMDQLRQQLADAGLSAKSLDVDDGSTWQDPRGRQDEASEAFLRAQRGDGGPGASAGDAPADDNDPSRTSPTIPGDRGPAHEAGPLDLHM